MPRISFKVARLAVLGALSASFGCANGDTVSSGAGGTSSSGGSPGNGGTTGQGGTGGTGGTRTVTTGGTTGTGGAPSTGGTTGTGGATGTTGAAGTVGGGGVGDGAATGTGGTTATGGTTSSGGASGNAGAGGFGQPACGNNSAGTAIAKGVACTASDPQLCYKTCGPASIGVKSESCVSSAYVEMSGCDFDPSMSYSCYKIPTTPNATCPTTTPQASAACSVATCVVCNSNGMYLDSKGNSNTGYCVCQASGKWTCASTNAWPCPNGPGC